MPTHDPKTDQDPERPPEDPEGAPVLQVLVASTRPGRLGRAYGEWIAARAEQHGAFAVELVDLAEVGLPFLDEPHHPRLGRYEHQHTRDWSATVTRADAFVFVTPEYYHGYNAVLKNAIDFLHAEWRDKPVGFCSYGGVSAGTRAVQGLKQVVAAVRMVPVFDGVFVPFAQQFVVDGAVRANEQMEAGATAMLDELARLVALLRPGR
jgi:NAD(P)H-dependent FMN reductase